MILTTVRPKNTNFEMTITLPIDYVGKEVHLLLYIDDEVNATNPSGLPSKKPSDFFGILTSRALFEMVN